MTKIKEQIEQLRQSSTMQFSELDARAQVAADTMEKLLAEIEKLQAEIYRKNERIKAWKKSSDEHEAENEKMLAVVEAARKLNFLNQRRTIEPFDFRFLNQALAALDEDDD